jgi:diguanylate cyclase (GGDEF)-like protein
MRRLLRALVSSADPSATRVLALACTLAATVAIGTVIFPFSATAPTHLNLVLALLGYDLAAILWLGRDRMPVVVLHAVVLTATVAVSAGIAASTTPSGPGVTAFSYVWIALYVAWFCSGTLVTAHLSAIVLGLAIGLAVADAPSPVQTWFFVVVCIAGVAGSLNALVRRLRALADRDPLTGLLNRMAFRAAAEHALALAGRTGRSLTIAVIDLDDFKLVNDRHGHAAGDQLLRELSAEWTALLRGGDVLGRYGGDEFVLLMPETTAPDAYHALERLTFAHPASWTGGVAEWTGETFEQWLARADVDLYARKGARGSRRPSASPTAETPNVEPPATETSNAETSNAETAERSVAARPAGGQHRAPSRGFA